jgi:hypothetical protein
MPATDLIIKIIINAPIPSVMYTAPIAEIVQLPGTSHMVLGDKTANVGRPVSLQAEWCQECVDTKSKVMWRYRD